MERRHLFYGTPLNKSLGRDKQDEDGPCSSRKARLNQQQTVRDSQGRQRFHGAFTGGFSAGYFNTVDSTTGFQPRQFISHRSSKGRAGIGPSFNHKPEDYMDEEDLGEFGIAPKKLRVSNQYSSTGSLDALGSLLKPVALTIGELILKRMSSNSISCQSTYNKTEINSSSQGSNAKNDFHGLGYKPLEVASKQNRSTNPLSAILGGGRKLKITGEAFGVGVLDDDEDFLTTNDAYGYDDIGNYEFSRRTRVDKHSSNITRDSRSDQDHSQIPGFISARCNDDAIKSCDKIRLNYPLPNIPDSWKMPTRAEIYIPPLNPSAIAQKLEFRSLKPGFSFSNKFTSGSQSISPGYIESKAGLVSYSDLRANELRIAAACDQVVESQNTKASLVRKELEWRPCSLLCKHFNVPNPYPDNSYCGVKPSSLIEDNLKISATDKQRQQSLSEIHQKPASLELRHSVFNVTFITDHEKVQPLKSTSDSEDEPQVVEVKDLVSSDKGWQQAGSGRDDEDDDQDVLVVTVSKREPEVIVLSSSSSSSSSQQSSRSPSPA